jgi:hypothetical protein
MVHCLLSQATESLKANMAAASVILGLLPTTLCLVGSGTAETGILARRRPLLSLLLACGSPGVSPIRTSEYQDPIGLLRKSPGHSVIRLPSLDHRTAAVVSALQYIAAVLAIANLAHVSWEVCVKTVCSFSSDTAYQPALWALLTVPIHLIGSFAVALRFRSFQNPTEDIQWKSRLRSEFPLAAQQQPLLPTETHEQKGTDYLSLLFSWIASTAAILHMIYGTMVFSSILFISAQDAVVVVARYLASTLVCRVVLRFEIMGLRDGMEMQEF